MLDKELYQTVLCLDTPWQVADVDLDLKESEIRVSVEHPRGVKFACQFKTFLIAKIPEETGKGTPGSTFGGNKKIRFLIKRSITNKTAQKSWIVRTFTV